MDKFLVKFDKQPVNPNTPDKDTFYRIDTEIDYGMGIFNARQVSFKVVSSPWFKLNEITDAATVGSTQVGILGPTPTVTGETYNENWLETEAADTTILTRAPGWDNPTTLRYVGGTFVGVIKYSGVRFGYTSGLTPYTTNDPWLGSEINTATPDRILGSPKPFNYGTGTVGSTAVTSTQSYVNYLTAGANGLGTYYSGSPYYYYTNVNSGSVVLENNWKETATGTMNAFTQSYTIAKKSSAANNPLMRLDFGGQNLSSAGNLAGSSPVPVFTGVYGGDKTAADFAVDDYIIYTGVADGTYLPPDGSANAGTGITYQASDPWYGSLDYLNLGSMKVLFLYEPEILTEAVRAVHLEQQHSLLSVAGVETQFKYKNVYLPSPSSEWPEPYKTISITDGNPRDWLTEMTKSVYKAGSKQYTFGGNLYMATPGEPVAEAIPDILDGIITGVAYIRQYLHTAPSDWRYEFGIQIATIKEDTNEVIFPVMNIHPTTFTSSTTYEQALLEADKWLKGYPVRFDETETGPGISEKTFGQALYSPFLGDNLSQTPAKESTYPEDSNKNSGYYAGKLTDINKAKGEVTFESLNNYGSGVSAGVTFVAINRIVLVEAGKNPRTITADELEDFIKPGGSINQQSVAKPEFNAVVKWQKGSSGYVITRMFVTTGKWTYSIIEKAVISITEVTTGASPDITVASLPAAGDKIVITSAGLKELIAADKATIDVAYTGEELLFADVDNSGANPAIKVFNIGTATSGGVVTVTVSIAEGLFDNGEDTMDLTLTVTAKVTSSTAITLTEATSITNNGSTKLTLGAVAGAFALTLNGTGDIEVGAVTNNLIIAGSGEYTADTVGGTLTISGDADVNTGNVTGAVTVSAGTVDTGTIGGNVTISGGSLDAGAITGTVAASGGTLKLDDNASAVGAITVTGTTFVLDLSGTTSTLGNVTINAANGVKVGFVFTDYNSFDKANGATVDSGGTTIYNDATTTYTSTIGGTSGTVTVGDVNTTAFSYSLTSGDATTTITIATA
jgi:hypothetical protein